MQTIKTGIVVVLLIAVCYGAFVALNTPEPDIPDELLSEFDWSADETDLENMMSIEMPTGDALQGVPTLPPSGGLSQGSSTDLSSNLPSFQGSPSMADLPSLPSLGTNSAPPIELPTLPADTNSQSPVNAADGPAVSLGGITNSLPNLPGSDSTSLNSSAATLPIANGQLVSQTRKPADSVDPAGQLPLLSNPNSPDAQSEGASLGGRIAETPTLPFTVAREQALEQAAAGKLKEALKLLSQYYDSPELNHAQHSDLVDILDGLAREVIYSRRHLSESPYTVEAGDSVDSLAKKYQITPELFAAINGLGDSKALVPGSQVKVLQGPFRGRVSLNRGELTVFLGGMYAGRFPIAIGADPSPSEGAFEVVDRRRDRTYYGTGGKVISAEDPRNPYGGYWLNLGQDLCIHGTPEMASSDLQDAGCISLAPLDAADVYNILAQGTQVSITR